MRMGGGTEADIMSQWRVKTEQETEAKEATYNKKATSALQQMSMPISLWLRPSQGPLCVFRC